MQSLVITATKLFGQTEGHTGHLAHCASHPASASLYEEENMCARFSVLKFDTCKTLAHMRVASRSSNKSYCTNWTAQFDGTCTSVTLEMFIDQDILAC